MSDEQTVPRDSGASPAAASNRAAGVPPVLDEAHLGDIRGAFGTISQHDSGRRRGMRSRLLALLAIMGPGLIVMVGDNDAGGVATYSQAGQTYGTSLLWALLLLIPVLIVNQEMVIRLGAVTGVGHARLINERFGRFWGWFSVGDLFLLNFLTIVTEFIGVSLALEYFGVSKYVAVPFGALVLIAITAVGSFEKWERFMYVFIVGNFLVIPLALLSHPNLATVAHDSVVPGIRGGASSGAVLLIIAIVGTTVAPWQLFFQQSNIIDKRITPRWINYERADTVIGSVVVVLGAGAMITVTAFAFGGTPDAGHFTDAGGVAAGLRHHLGSTAGAFYAIVLLNASMIGAAAVTLATSYAVGDVLQLRHSLHRGVRDAKGFYAIFAGLIAGAAGIVLIPGAPLGVITESVQALAGVLLPSASVFLLLLCNDREILGPWINRPWLNALASLIISILLMLSMILVISTLFPSVNVAHLSVYLAIGLVVGLAAFALYTWRPGRSTEVEPIVSSARRETWTMPPLALLGKPERSPGRSAAMFTLSAYLLVAIVMLTVKAVQLGGG